MVTRLKDIKIDHGGWCMQLLWTWKCQEWFIPLCYITGNRTKFEPSPQKSEGLIICSTLRKPRPSVGKLATLSIKIGVERNLSSVQLKPATSVLTDHVIIIRRTALTTWPLRPSLTLIWDFNKLIIQVYFPVQFRTFWHMLIKSNLIINKTCRNVFAVYLINKCWNVIKTIFGQHLFF